MPFYEYECQACKFYTEVMQKISDAPLTRCPSCGKQRLKKLVSAPVFRLKGGGWYETDFKSDKESKRNLVGAEREEPKAETKAEVKEGKSEAKEAKPAAAKPAEPAAAGAARSRATVSVGAGHKGPKSVKRKTAPTRRR